MDPVELGPRTLRAVVAAIIWRDGGVLPAVIADADALLARLAETEARDAD